VFLARVIGNVWATKKDDHLKGLTLQVIQPMDGRRNDVGEPVVAVDTVGAGRGETVMYITAREAVIPLPVGEAPVDAAIVGIVDRIDISE
jgi:ethanolamine utilization protein EutN